MAALRAQEIFETLHRVGLSVQVTSGGKLGVSPSSLLTDALRVLIRANKAEMLDWLQAANDPAPEPPADPNAWRELAQAYHQHHLNCKTCIAAGRGARYGVRCGTGQTLWNFYQTN